MSSLLEQAIVDATALKEAAMKNAEKNLIEKYSSKIKEAVDKLLEQGEETGVAPVDTGLEATAEVDPATELENTPSDLAAQAQPTPALKDPLEKVKPTYLKSSDDNEKITIDFSSLKAKPAGGMQAGSMLPVTPVAPMAAPAAAPAAPAAAPLAEGLSQYEEDEGEIMAEVELDETADEGDDCADGAGMSENLQALVNDGAAPPPQAADVVNDPSMEETVEIHLGDDLEEDATYGNVEAVEDLEEYGEQEQDESGAYPEEESLSLEEEVTVDMRPVSDGYRSMQPNEKRELMDVALAQSQDEEYQRQMAEYEEALSASENKLKKSSIKNKSLVKENEELKKTLMSLKEHIEGMNLSNAKLLYMNRILGNPSLNERQKSQIVESISRTDSVEGAKIAFDTLQSAVGSAKEVKAPKSLNEAVSRSSSPFLVRPRTQENPQADRMRLLAGIIKK
jgi:hypothetical protein